MLLGSTGMTIAKRLDERTFTSFHFAEIRKIVIDHPIEILHLLIEKLERLFNRDRLERFSSSQDRIGGLIEHIGQDRVERRVGKLRRAERPIVPRARLLFFIDRNPT